MDDGVCNIMMQDIKSRGVNILQILIVMRLKKGHVRQRQATHRGVLAQLAE